MREAARSDSGLDPAMLQFEGSTTAQRSGRLELALSDASGSTQTSAVACLSIVVLLEGSTLRKADALADMLSLPRPARPAWQHSRPCSCRVTCPAVLRPRGAPLAAWWGGAAGAGAAGADGPQADNLKVRMHG